MNPERIELVCPGKPTPRYEPHLDLREAIATSDPSRRRYFDDFRTRRGMARWRSCWDAAGRPCIPGPVELELVIETQRPPSHLTSRGLLSSSGRRHPVPARFDCSNVLKLVEDALKDDRAFWDDVWVAKATVLKRFGPVDQMRLVITPWGGVLPVQTTLTEEVAQ